MKTIITICFLCFLTGSFAQKTGSTRLEKSGEKGRGSTQNITIRQTIQSTDGKIVAVGTTSSRRNGGTDGYVTIFSPTGQDTLVRKFGGRGDDAFNSIAQLPDGSFLIAGSTEVGNKESAWLVQIDETGAEINRKVFTSNVESAFQAVVATEDGGAFLVGTYQEGVMVDIRYIKLNNFEKEFEKNINIGGFVKNIKSAVLAKDGGVVLVVDTKAINKVKEDNIWVCKLDKKGEKIPFNKQFGENKYRETAAQIIRTSDNGFAIVGTTDNSRGKSDNAWLLKLDETGIEQWQKDYGERKLDAAFSVVQTNTDQYYLVGESSSHNADARTTQIFFVKTDAAGNELWKDYDGEKQNDKAYFITQLHDGRFFLSASTEGNAWFYRFKATDEILENFGISEKSFSQTDWTINTNSGFAEANKRTSLSVKLRNMTANLIKNVQIKCTSPSPNIQVQAVSYIGSFRRNETKILHIPLKTDVGIEDKSYSLSFEVLVDNTIIDNFTYNKITGKKATPQSVYFKIPPQYPKGSTGETIVKLSLDNPTKSTVQGLSVQIELPKGLTAKSPTKIDIAPLGAGKTVDIVLKHTGTIKTELGAAKPQLIYRLFNKTVKTDEVQIDALPTNNTANTGNLIVWYKPDEGKEDIKNIKVSKPKFPIELRSFTTEPVTRDNFKIFVDEESLEGSKLDVVDLTAPSMENNLYQQVYTANIELDVQKRYTIRVDVQLSNGSLVSSKLLIVEYNPEKANLHVLSIGTTQEDLKYTAKDAADIAQFFKTQANPAFKNRYVEEYSQANKTDNLEFRKAFFDLTTRYENAESDRKIEEKDFLIVFISSHGKTGNDKKYKLLPSGYSNSGGDFTAVDYQTDVLGMLDKIRCHKLIFIDACHSGLVQVAEKSRDNAEALMKISQAAIGTTIIASCKSDEKSFEDDTWRNGFFTKALLDAFKNEIYSDSKGQYSSDENKDGLITIGEIFNFIQRRVPSMVEEVRKGSNSKQNPVLVKNGLDLDIPLIFLEK
ncbi:MAG: caspase family protein [Saprospiraceae bacterium]|nr:caspase family protein [Saprospiraceae bacterium]